MTEFSNPMLIGLIPEIITDRDPRPVHEQIESGYAHGGGWRPMPGFRLTCSSVAGKSVLNYPVDPALHEISRAQIGEELVMVFDCDFVVVVAANGGFAVTRMD